MTITPPDPPRTNIRRIYLFKKWAILGLFFFIFVFSIQLTVNKWMSVIKVCRWQVSNRGHLALEATALPTEPQPLSKKNIFINVRLRSSKWSFSSVNLIDRLSALVITAPRDISRLSLSLSKCKAHFVRTGGIEITKLLAKKFARRFTRSKPSCCGLLDHSISTEIFLPENSTF